jgi:hypothetical protein
MPSIGNIAVQLAADPSKFISGLDSAAKSAEKFGAQVGKILTSPAALAGKALSVPTNAIEGALKPVHDLVSAIPLIGGALGAIPTTAGGFVGFIKAAVDDLAELDKSAKRLGVSVELLSGLEKFAEPLQTALPHLARELGEVAMGGEQAARTFKKFGLDADKLALQPLEQSFRDVIARISEMQNPLKQDLALFEMFGKKGQDLGGLVRSGPGGIDKVMQKAKTSGLLVNDNEVRAAADASRAFKEIDLAVKGLGRQFAIGLSPFLKEAAEWFNSLIESSGGAKALVESVIDFIVSAVSGLMDALESLYKDLKKLAHPGDFIKDQFDRAGGLVNPFGDRFLDLRAASMSADERAEEARGGSRGSGAGDRLRNFWGDFKGRRDVGGGGGGSGDFGDIVAIDSISDQADKLKTTLRDSMDAFGLHGAAADVWKLKMRAAKLGVTDDVAEIIADLDRFAKAQKELEKAFHGPVQAMGLMGEHKARADVLFKMLADGTLKADEFKGKMQALREEFDGLMDRKAGDLFQETRTSFEKLKAQIDNLDTLK